MPLRLLRAHIEMLPRLQAEEALMAASVAAASSPYTKERDRKRVLREWEREAQAGREPVREPPREALRRFTALSGIKSVVERSK